VGIPLARQKMKPKFSYTLEFTYQPMLPIFGDFCRFPEKKMEFFFETNVITISQKFGSILSQKNPPIYLG
jgi:hypothetical protein